MIELILILSLIFSSSIIIMMMMTLRKVSIERRKQIVEMEFDKIKNR